MCGMSRRNDISVLLAHCALALRPRPPRPSRKPVDSWGRAGVDYETYRNDSLECGLVGYYADVSQTEQAQAFVSATRQLEWVDNPNYVPPGASAGAGRRSAWIGSSRPGAIRADPPEHPPRAAG